jgi:hypothetical protein
MTDTSPPSSPQSPPEGPKRKLRIRQAKAPIKRGRPPALLAKPDINTLLELIEKRRLEQQAVARALSISPALFSRSIHGGRDFTAREAVALAKLLGRNTDDVLRILGHAVTDVGVPLAGKVLPDGRVSPMLGARKGEKVRSAQPYPDSVAYVYEPTNTRFIVDRDITRSPLAVPPEAYDRWCVVEAEGHDLPLFGKLERASARGVWTLSCYPGLSECKPRQVKVHNAAVVIEIISP